MSNCIGVYGGGPRILLVGDSNAVMLYPAFKAIAKRLGATLAVAHATAARGSEDLLYADLRHQDVCATNQADFYDRIIPELDPDVVVLMNRTFDDPNSLARSDTPDGRFEPGTPEFVPAVRRTTERSVEALRRDGRKIVLVEPTPFSPRKLSPNVCLSRAKTVDECRYVASPGPMGVERMYREIADDDGRRLGARHRPARLPVPPDLRPGGRRRDREGRPGSHHRDLRPASHQPRHQTVPPGQRDRRNDT